MSQVEIATQLRITQSTVSRMIDYAFEQGFLTRPRPKFEETRVPAPDLADLESRFSLVPMIAKEIRKIAPDNRYFEVHVVGAETRSDFCAQAAQVVYPLVATCPLIGVSLGGTLAGMIHAMQAHSELDRRPARPPECIPVCGDCLYLMDLHVQTMSASALAGDLAFVLTGARSAELPSLTGVPAYAARIGRPAQKVAGVQEFIEGLPGYQKVFGSKAKRQRPLVDQLACLLSGVGILVPEDEESEESSTGACIRERILQEGLTVAELAACIYGDIGGYLLPKENLSAAQEKKVQALNDGWFGVKESHLELLSKRAAKDRPGIVLIAQGEPKAFFLRKCIERGFANHLVIDVALAKGILKKDPA
jgi:DNA-binding Lrp family transcriptional regulator